MTTEEITSKELKSLLKILDNRTLKKYAQALKVSFTKGGYHNRETVYLKSDVDKFKELHEYLQIPGNTIEGFLLLKENERLKLKLFLGSFKDSPSPTPTKLSGQIIPIEILEGEFVS